MIGVARRRVMGGGSATGWPLKYWLSGEDAPVNGQWRDRKNANIKWNLTNGVTHDSSNGRYRFLGRTNADAAYLEAQYVNNYDLGYHFKMIISGTFIDTISTSGNNYNVMIDFGSVTMASKNMGWGYMPSDNGFYTNYKLNGNPSLSSYMVDATNSLADMTTSPYDFVVEFGSEAVTDSTSRMYMLYNDVYYYGPVYNNILLNNWDSRNFLIARGYAGVSYGCDFYLNDWKIYVENY